MIGLVLSSLSGGCVMAETVLLVAESGHPKDVCMRCPKCKRLGFLEIREDGFHCLKCDEKLIPLENE